MAVDTPVTPFGATAAGAWALVPEAKLYDVPLGDPLPVGKFGVRIAQLEAWVAELSGDVAVRLDGWERLDNDPVLDADGVTVLVEGDRDRFRTWAAGIVHNGAASYLEAARYPERAGTDATSYAAVLWQRYTDGLARVEGWLADRLALGAVGDVLEPAAGGIAFNFPAPLFGDALRF